MVGNDTSAAPPLFTAPTARVAAALFIAGLLCLLTLQVAFGINPVGVSSSPHFIYQAWSFLHGRWDLDLPPSVVDIIVVHGKDYTIYPPFPAVLMLPFVAIFGTATSDVLFLTICSALNLSLLFLLLEQARRIGLSARSMRQNAVIAVLLWLGSISLWLSLDGGLWYTAHIVALGCGLLSLLFALQRRFTWSAVAMACGFLTRGPLLLAFPLVLFLAWQTDPRDNLFACFAVAIRRRQVSERAVPWRRLAGPLVVFAVAVAVFMLRNQAVFGSPFESGYNIIIQQRYPGVRDGVFSLRYVPANFIANFFDFPRVIFQGQYDRQPAIDWLNGGMGISVFVTTPLFLFLFARNRAFHPLRAALWITVALIVASVLLFHWTGWLQFGARYLMEAYPFAFLLLAMNDLRFDWRWVVLGLAAIEINLLGAAQIWAVLLPHGVK